MIDINLIREKPEYVKEALKKKLWDADFTELLAWDKEKKDLIQIVEGNKAEMNRLSASVPQLKKEGKDPSEVFKKVKEIAVNELCGKKLIDQNAKFCSNCGAPRPATWICSVCGCNTNTTNRFCNDCGSPKN